MSLTWFILRGVLGILGVYTGHWWAGILLIISVLYTIAKATEDEMRN